MSQSFAEVLPLLFERGQLEQWWVLQTVASTGETVYWQGFDRCSGRLLFTRRRSLAGQFRSSAEATIAYWAMGGAMSYVLRPSRSGEKV